MRRRYGWLLAAMVATGCVEADRPRDDGALALDQAAAAAPAGTWQQTLVAADAWTVVEGGEVGRRAARFFVGERPVRALELRVGPHGGLVLHLNGREAARVPAAPGGDWRALELSALVPRLRASELNELTITSTDDAARVDAELVAWIDGRRDVTSEDGVPRGSYWRFRAGADAPAGWQATSFDDRDWPAGREPHLRDAGGEAATTAWVRKPFVARGAVHGLTAAVRHDGAFVAYLNGHEIARVPAGPADDDGDGHRTFDWSAALPHLDDGANTLALELHAPSASAGFDLELTLDGAWRPQPAATDAWWQAIHFADPQRGWRIGLNGVIHRTTDGGARWQPQRSGTTAHLRALTFADADHGWIAATQGLVLRTTDGGERWTEVSLGDGALALDLSFVDATTGWVGGANGTVHHTRDGGESWTPLSLGVDRNVVQVDFADATTGWAAVASDDAGPVLYRTTDGGVSWQPQGPLLDGSRSITDLEVIDARTVWFATRGHHDDAGEDKWVSRDGGQTWAEAPDSASDVVIRRLHFVDAQHGWALGAGGAVIATRDGGLSWQVQRPPALQPDADRVVGAPPFHVDLHLVAPTHGWIVGSGGAVLHTRTGGW